MIVLAASVGARAGITNGRFDSSLAGWSVASGEVIWWPGPAFAQSARLGPDTDNETFPHSRLEQTIHIDSSAETLCFDLVMPGAFGGETDVFTACLLDADTHCPLLAVDSQPYYFLLESDGDLDDSLVTISGDTICLDVRSLAGSDALLQFDLQHDYLDGRDTYVFLDNVTLEAQAIPAPPVLVLQGIALGALALHRRRRQIR
ncbi:MAG: hypothetical protein JW810_11010 [Sedimentisphaerales bacterium]|nr:hypothetical protein [Sedimentisphaerales bacterium]